MIPKKNFFGIFFLFVFFGFFSLSLAAPSEQSLLKEHQFFLKDAYQKNYEEIASQKNENSVFKQALDITAERIGISPENLQLLLTGKAVTDCNSVPTPEGKKTCQQAKGLNMEDLASVCPAELQNDLTVCWKELQNVYEKEVVRQKFLVQPLKKYTLASEVFSNGTLQDTGGEGFDLVVDLNIIDLILFGDKYSSPRGPSPFLRENGKNILPQNLSSGTGVDYGENENNDKEQNCETNEDSKEEDKKDEEKQKEMCMDPEILIFKKSSSGGNGEEEEIHKCGENATLEELFPKKTGLRYLEYSYRKGGEYPDFGFGNGQCEEDEKPFLGGWICVPEFCTDLLCIKIDIVPGYRKANLSNKNCVECHIDRANEALVKLLGNLGRNTPNNSPLEPYFLTAFANLFRDVFDTITLKPRKLPFLVYDESLTEQKKEKEKPKTEEEKQNMKKKLEAKRKAFFLAQNKQLYDMLHHRCYPSSSPILTDRQDDFTDYCKQYKSDELAYLLTGSGSSSAMRTSAAEEAAKNAEHSNMFHNVVKPFFKQLSGDMETVNAHFFDISPEFVQSKAQSCNVIAQ